MSMGTLQELLLSKAATERFFKNISLPTSPDGCWEWTGTKIDQGYGHHFCGIETRKTARVHRIAYEVWKGQIPEGLTIDHLCYNRACVNPLHLEPVTRGDNVRRARARVTHCPRGHEYTLDNIKKKSFAFRESRNSKFQLNVITERPGTYTLVRVSRVFKVCRAYKEFKAPKEQQALTEPKELQVPQVFLPLLPSLPILLWPH